MRTFTATVYGRPAPQGSKRHVGHGAMVESSKYVAPWREGVVAACRAVIDAEPGFTAFDGPLYLMLTFTVAKPTSAPKTKRTYPDRRPDLSKLIRSTEDALTDAGVIVDDARVVGISASKVYPGEETGALDTPGATILVRRVA